MKKCEEKLKRKFHRKEKKLLKTKNEFFFERRKVVLKNKKNKKTFIINLSLRKILFLKIIINLNRF